MGICIPKLRVTAHDLVHDTPSPKSSFTTDSAMLGVLITTTMESTSRSRLFGGEKTRRENRFGSAQQRPLTWRFCAPCWPVRTSEISFPNQCVSSLLHPETQCLTNNYLSFLRPPYTPTPCPSILRNQTFIFGPEGRNRDIVGSILAYERYLELRVVRLLSI